MGIPLGLLAWILTDRLPVETSQTVCALVTCLVAVAGGLHLEHHIMKGLLLLWTLIAFNVGLLSKVVHLPRFRWLLFKREWYEGGAPPETYKAATLVESAAWLCLNWWVFLACILVVMMLLRRFVQRWEITTEERETSWRFGIRSMLVLMSLVAVTLAARKVAVNSSSDLTGFAFNQLQFRCTLFAFALSGFYGLSRIKAGYRREMVLVACWSIPLLVELMIQEFFASTYGFTKTPRVWILWRDCVLVARTFLGMICLTAFGLQVWTITSRVLQLDPFLRPIKTSAGQGTQVA
jgi:hypothetical protein